MKLKVDPFFGVDKMPFDFNNPVHHTNHRLFPVVLSTLTLRGLEVGLLLLLDGLCIIVGRAFVHGQRGDLLVGLAAVVAVVRLARCVYHVVLVEAGVLGEALFTARHSAHIRLLTCRSGSEVNEGPGPWKPLV